MLIWLALFGAKTEEDFRKIKGMEVLELNETISVYRSVAGSPEYREMERLRSKARHDEAQAIHDAKLEEKSWRQQ